MTVLVVTAAEQNLSITGIIPTTPLDILRKTRRNFKIKARRFEFDFLSSQLGPLVSCSIDPTDQIKMIYIFQSS
jgi:hypothetical protein